MKISLKTDGKWLLLIALCGFSVFASSLKGEFVYDDRRQIVMNPLVQQPDLYRRAVASDVWAFKSDGNLAASNYWRPTFTAWCILNFNLFGLSPFGWHLLNLLLHLGVCALAYLLLRGWGVKDVVSFCIVLGFAVHPVHTESVAWISGSPDLLFAFFLLLSFWLAERSKAMQGRNRYILIACAAAAYLLALGSKEVALLCFPIYYLIFSDNRENRERKAMVDRSAVALTGILAATAVVFFLVRLRVLGQFSLPAEGAASAWEALLTAPAAFCFYLRQMIFPYWLGPNYSLRPIGAFGLTTVLLPLAVGILASIGLWLIARRSHIQQLGLAIFILPLLPVFNIVAFNSEHIVHNRYLYLPLLGFLMVVVPYVAEKVTALVPSKPDPVLVGSTALIALLLAIATWNYTAKWQTDMTLWQYAVTVDPGCSSCWSALGVEFLDQEKYPDALSAYNRSVSINPRPPSLVGRAQTLVYLGRIDDALRDVTPVLAKPLDQIDAYTLYQAYEAYALALQDKGDLAGAEKAVRQARSRLPIYYASLTEKLAIILYNENRKPEALSELESAVPKISREMLPSSKAVFFRLGMLHAEQGNKRAAIENLKLYLSLTRSAKDRETDAERQAAEDALRRL